MKILSMKLFLYLLILGPIGSFFAMKPKELIPDSKPFDVPDAEVGTSIPVLFGTRAIKSPFVAWYGDVEIILVEMPSSGKK